MILLFNKGIVKRINKEVMKVKYLILLLIGICVGALSRFVGNNRVTDNVDILLDGECEQKMDFPTEERRCKGYRDGCLPLGQILELDDTRSKDVAMWKGLLWSPMRQCTVGYGKINARKVLCTNIFVGKGRNTTNVEIHLQEEDISPIVWI